jgi:hypothetical protein
MVPPVDPPSDAFTRLIADRRRGIDQRVEPRRRVLAGAPAARERRAVVDRRSGVERRSTIERRGRVLRRRPSEGPAEHVRNALQLLSGLTQSAPDLSADLSAALERLRHALELLERR